MRRATISGLGARSSAGVCLLGSVANMSTVHIGISKIEPTLDCGGRSRSHADAFSGSPYRSLRKIDYTTPSAEIKKTSRMVRRCQMLPSQGLRTRRHIQHRPRILKVTILIPGGFLSRGGNSSDCPPRSIRLVQ